MSKATNALVTNPGASFADRRQVFGFLGGAVAIAAGADQASAAIAKTGPSSVFTGDYDDPNHPECLRQVKVVGAPQRANGQKPSYAVVEVTGYDGKEGEKICKEQPTRADLWKIQGKTKTDTEAVLDFSPKGGPADLAAKWDGDGIVFPDGNKWTKMPYGANTSSRRPKDTSTLTSD